MQSVGLFAGHRAVILSDPSFFNSDWIQPRQIRRLRHLNSWENTVRLLTDPRGPAPREDAHQNNHLFDDTCRKFFPPASPAESEIRAKAFRFCEVSVVVEKNWCRLGDSNT